MKQPIEKTIVLVDGSSFLFRAFHALPPLTNFQGEPTGAILGVSNMLRKLLTEYPGAQVVVIFDAPGKTFRHEMYDQYKANRPPMDDDLRRQIAPLHELIKVMGFPLVMEPGVEADDVIGTFARQAAATGLKVVVSTGDKDMAQLVNEQITLENTMTNSRMDPQGVKDKFGVTPEQIIDYLALVGDSSDNIPGVPKVGPKTAAKWLGEYGSVDELISRAAEVKGKVGENLRNGLETLKLSRKLATIKCDLSLPENVTDLQLAPADDEKLRELLEQFEFSSWLKQLDRKKPTAISTATTIAEIDAAAPADDVTATYDLVLTAEQFEKWLNKLKQATIFAFDTETTSLNYISAEVVGVSFSVEPGEAAYVPVSHSYPGAPTQLSRDWVLEKLRPLLEDESVSKVGQNLKYDRNVLLNHGIMLRGIKHDTMLESYILNSVSGRHNMDDMASRFLGYKTTHYEEIAGKGAKQLSFQEISLEQAAPYAAEDADITLRLHHCLWPKLEAKTDMSRLYQEVEIPLVPVLSRIERNGVLIDSALLSKQSHELAVRMLEIEQAAYDEAGQPFNLASPKQIQEILFEQQGLPVLKKTPKGQPSTNEAVLQELAETYALPRLILENRGISKLKSTYTDRLPEQVSEKTGRIHTSYHQAVTATGRLSSSNPNLQNIPIRTAEGRRIRQAFIVPQGYKMLAADYSQIELRIMAHLSEDEGLLGAFVRGEDVHKSTAAEVFGVTLDEVTQEQRRSAKAINFGLIYGMSAFGLARQLGIPRNEAQAYVDRYFSRYPGVKEYMDSTRELAKEKGYVETLFGRRLYLPDINARNGQRRQYAERTAINAPMQGTAADIIKKAMIDVDQWVSGDEVPVQMIMQVHDELVFEVAEDYLKQATQKIDALMSHATKLNVPLIVDIGSGNNWDEAH
ncbi:MAG: DNA polymerase I [Gammaproteobacteria bacterium]|nr:MAG: DNA polymerase I [Gammaproteobacteria bacterium]